MPLPRPLQEMIDHPEGPDGTANFIQAFRHLTSRGFSERISEQIVLYAWLRSVFLDANDVIEAARELGFDTELLMMPDGEA